MKKLEVKDFVSIGIFSALFVVFVVIVSILQVVPILSLGYAGNGGTFHGTCVPIVRRKNRQTACRIYHGLDSITDNRAFIFR